MNITDIIEFELFDYPSGEEIAKIIEDHNLQEWELQELKEGYYNETILVFRNPREVEG